MEIPMSDEPVEMGDLRCDRCPCLNTAHGRDDGACLTPSCPCPGWAPPTGTWPLMGPADCHGESGCCDCSRPLPEGAPYSERLVALIGQEDTIVEVVCVYCAHTGERSVAPSQTEKAHTERNTMNRVDRVPIGDKQLNAHLAWMNDNGWKVVAVHAIAGTFYIFATKEF